MTVSMEDITEQLGRLELCSRPLQTTPALNTLSDRDDVPAASSPACPIRQGSSSATSPKIISSSSVDSDQATHLDLSICSPGPAGWAPPSVAQQAQQVTTTKPHLLTLPVEILNRILTPLLIHPDSVTFPMRNNSRFDFPRPYPSLSPSVLSTCRHLCTIGFPLFYCGNAFNPNAHLGLYFGSPRSGRTILREITRRLVGQLEVELERLSVHVYMPLIEVMEFDMLNEVLRLYLGNIEDVHSIRCIVYHSNEMRPVAIKTLRMEQEWGDAWNVWQAAGRVPGPTQHQLQGLAERVTDCLLKWNAMLIAGTVEKRCPGFSKMYRAVWTVWNLRKSGIVICRGGELLRKAIRANKLGGVQFVAELEVDLKKGVVREVDGERAGHNY
jgi:hypothetical protein